MIKMVTLFIVLLVAGTAMLGSYLAPDDLAQCQTLPSLEGVCQKADAVVAISGGNTSERVLEAIELFKLGWGKKLIFSGAAKDTSGPSNAEVMKRQAIDAGVSPDDILIENFAQTTKQNAMKTTTVFQQYSIDDVILVTSPYHQRRASLEFHAAVGGDIVLRNHPTRHDTDWSQWWWLTPRGWWLAGGEVVKILAFYVGQSQ